MKLVPILLIAAAIASAQISSATPSGVVTDVSSAAVSCAVVEALQTGTEFSRSTVTDSGSPQETARTTGSGQAYLRENVFAVYAQDEWRLTRRLTVNFGVRWEFAAPFIEARNNLLNLDYSTLPAPPQLERVHTALDALGHAGSQSRFGTFFRKDCRRR